MGSQKLLATRKAKLFCLNVYGFRQTVGVKHIAIALLQRDFDR